MSYDLFFQDAAQPEIMEADAAAAVSKVMHSHGGPSKPDEHGFFFELADGGYIEFYGKLDSPGGMLALRHFSEGVARFILDLLQATGWIVLVPGEELIALATKPISLDALMGEDACDLRVVATAEAVADALFPGFQSWSEYRDQVADGPLPDKAAPFDGSD